MGSKSQNLDNCFDQLQSLFPRASQYALATWTTRTVNFFSGLESKDLQGQAKNPIQVEEDPSQESHKETTPSPKVEKRTSGATKKRKH